jgi:hypothetical protein
LTINRRLRLRVESFLNEGGEGCGTGEEVVVAEDNRLNVCHCAEGMVVGVS